MGTAFVSLILFVGVLFILANILILSGKKFDLGNLLRNPLYILGVMIMAQAVSNPNLSFWYSVLFLVTIAYVQNISYGLQSRAGTRSSNAFHAFTAVLASLVFFTTLRYLYREQIPLMLLPAYMFATIFGSLHGNVVSRIIEKRIGAGIEAPKNQPQLMRFWPSMLVLMIALAGQVFFLPSSLSPWMIGGLALLTLVDNFAFAVLRLARSSDNYWFHGFAALLQSGAKFLGLVIMFNYEMNWALFLPTTTGGVMGSLTGQYFALSISSRLKAKFDSHVVGDKKIEWPILQTGVFLLGMLIHGIIFGTNNFVSVMLLLGYAFGQSVSFAVVSRARQRNHDTYLIWASVFSNGVWYLTMHQLALKNITPDKTAPYVVGGVTGSLAGQNIAMHVEKKINARMDVATV